MKLLLKLIQDHQEASVKGSMDERKEQRFAGIMTILEDVKTRMQKSQSSAKKGKELRRCYTDLRVNPPKPGHKKDETLILDEKEKLRRDLNTSYAAQKRLGIMCASLGREKEIISRELTRKVQELNEMEEHINDLRAQNERLSTKIQACVADHHKEIQISGNGSENNINYAATQQRNKELSEQLVKSLEGYKLMKRKHKEVKEERDVMQFAIEELGDEVKHSIDIVYNLNQHVSASASASALGEKLGKVEENITSLDHVFQRLHEKITRLKKETK